MATSYPKKFVSECEAKLLELRNNHIESLRIMKSELVTDTSSDPADQARDSQEKMFNLAQSNKISAELREVELALERIKREDFGVCEVTGELIEPGRLKALPWTRLSREGVEIHEAEMADEAFA